MDKTIKNFLLSIGLFILLVFSVKYAFIYLSPFIIAGIMASMINPVVYELESRLKINRGIAVLTVLMLLIAIIAVMVMLGVSQTYIELNNLLRNLPDYQTIGDRMQWLLNQNNEIQRFINNLEISDNIKVMLNNNLQMLYDGIRNSLVRIINMTLGYISKLPIIFTILFLSFIACFFISRDKDVINKFVVDIFPENYKSQVIRIRDELIASSIGFIRAELILISISGVIAGIGTAVLGYQYALLIGLTAAFLDLIPIIGPGLIYYPWILFNLLTRNIVAGIQLLFVYLILAGVRSGAQGKIMGENLGLHPLSVMIALYVGYRVMGGLGFIVGPTVMVLVKAFFRAERE